MSRKRASLKIAQRQRLFRLGFTDAVTASGLVGRVGFLGVFGFEGFVLAGFFDICLESFDRSRFLVFLPALSFFFASRANVFIQGILKHPV